MKIARILQVVEDKTKRGRAIDFTQVLCTRIQKLGTISPSRHQTRIDLFECLLRSETQNETFLRKSDFNNSISLHIGEVIWRCIE